MKIKFVKAAFGYKADQEIEVTAEEVKSFGDAVVEVKSEEVAAEAVAASVKEVLDAVDAKINVVEKKIAKAFSDRKATITVTDRTLDEDPQKGFKSLGAFAHSAKAFAEGNRDDSHFEQYLKATGHSVAVDADGGYAVPQIWANEIFSDLQSGPNLLPLCRNFPMTVGDILNVPADATTTIGTGMTAAWVAEAGTISVTKTAQRNITLQPYKLAILTATTDELERDAQALSAYLQSAAAYHLNYAINNAIVRGNASSKPQGFLGYAGTVTQLRTTASTVAFADLANMYARFYGDESKAVWLVNSEVWIKLVQLTSGNFNIFLNNGALKDAPVMSIFGIPVVKSEHMSTLGSEGDIALVDLSKYFVATKGGVEQAESVHLYFNKQENAYRFTVRLDGKPSRATVLTPASGQGTLTKSPFVVLDDATT